jgi:signal transduction histidine kinase
MAESQGTRISRAERPALFARAFMAVVVLGTVSVLGAGVLSSPHDFAQRDLIFWVLVLATVELLPVSVSRVLQLSLGFPIRLGVAMLYAPYVAAGVALIGSFDKRELKGEITPLKSAFNRSQIALATLASGWVLHAFSSQPVALVPGILIPAALAATVVNYGVNVSLVTLAMRLLYKVSARDVLGQLRVGALSEFLTSYLLLGSVGVIVAEFYEKVGTLAVAAFILPLIFARQMFFRNMELEEAHKELQGKNVELKDRARVLRALSNRIADERKEEREQIAAYLHDDTAQMLYRLSLQIEMAKRRLGKGEVDTVQRNLEEIDDTRKGTDQTIRALIRDLHRSPIGRGGLAEAITSYAEDARRGLDMTITVDVGDVSLPSAIQLLVYQITREAVMNAIKHAEAENIWVSLAERDDVVELMIKDDGKGFDTSAAEPEGHFGSIMMRERALVTGGTFSRESEPGQGATIRATFPHVWVEEELLESSPGAPTSAAPTGEPAAGPAWGNGHGASKDGEPVRTEDLGPIATPPAKEPSEGGRPTRSGTWRPPPDDQPRQIPAW